MPSPRLRLGLRSLLLPAFLLILLRPPAASAAASASRAKLHAPAALEPSDNLDVLRMAVQEALGGAAGVLDPARLADRVSRSKMFLKSAGRVCDGTTERAIDTSSLGIVQPLEGETPAAFQSRDAARFTNFCKARCVADSSCACFNVERGEACNLQTGPPQLKRESNVSSYLRVEQSTSTDPRTRQNGSTYVCVCCA